MDLDDSRNGLKKLLGLLLRRGRYGAEGNQLAEYVSLLWVQLAHHHLIAGKKTDTDVPAQFPCRINDIRHVGADEQPVFLRLDDYEGRLFGNGDGFPTAARLPEDTVLAH